MLTSIATEDAAYMSQDIAAAYPKTDQIRLGNIAKVVLIRTST